MKAYYAWQQSAMGYRDFSRPVFFRRRETGFFAIASL
jgi:hypothetical protein